MLRIACIMLAIFGSIWIAEEASQAQEKPASISLEVTQQQNYVRIIFRMQGVDDFIVEQNGHTLRITLDRPFMDTLDALPVSATPYIISAAVGENRNTILLTLGVDALKLRKFIGEGFFGIDLVGITEASSAAQPGPPFLHSPSSTPVTPKEAAIGPLQPLAATAPSTTVKKSSTAMLIPLSSAVAAGDEKERSPAQARHKTTTAAIGPFPHAPTLPGPSSKKAALIKAALPVLPSASSPALSMERIRLKDGINLVFPWREDVAAAVFTRGDSIWIAFDRARTIQFQSLEGMKYIAEMEQIAHQDFSILRLKVDKDTTLIQPSEKDPRHLLRLHAYRDGFTWMVTIREATKSASEDETSSSYAPAPPLKYPVAMAAQSAKENRATIAELLTEKVSRVLEIKDPTLGDTLIIVPLLKEGAGVQSIRHFVAFKLPQTIQGVVINQLSDRLRYELMETGVRIVSSVGLSTPTSAAEIPQENPSNARTAPIDAPSEIPKDVEASTIFPFPSAIGEQFPTGMYFTEKLVALRGIDRFS